MASASLQLADRRERNLWRQQAISKLLTISEYFPGGRGGKWTVPALLSCTGQNLSACCSALLLRFQSRQSMVQAHFYHATSLTNITFAKLKNKYLWCVYRTKNACNGDSSRFYKATTGCWECPKRVNVFIRSRLTSTGVFRSYSANPYKPKIWGGTIQSKLEMSLPYPVSVLPGCHTGHLFSHRVDSTFYVAL